MAYQNVGVCALDVSDIDVRRRSNLRFEAIVVKLIAKLINFDDILFEDCNRRIRIHFLEGFFDCAIIGLWINTQLGCDCGTNTLVPLFVTHLFNLRIGDFNASLLGCLNNRLTAFELFNEH